VKHVKRLITVSVGVGLMTSGIIGGASPAMANTCAGPVYFDPLDPTAFVNVCADVQTFNPGPGAGEGVEAAASYSLNFNGGYTHGCTGYFGAGVSVVGFTPVVVPVIGSPSAC